MRSVNLKRIISEKFLFGYSFQCWDIRVGYWIDNNAEHVLVKIKIRKKKEKNMLNYLDTTGLVLESLLVAGSLPGKDLEMD